MTGRDFGDRSFVQFKTVKPKALKRGDLIGVIAPGGAIFETNRIKKFQNILEEIGFKVKFGKTIYERYGYLAGKDEFRAQEVNEMFQNDEIKGIIAMRGGNGCARILPMINYNLIRNNPKVFVGFSDITTLLNAFYAKAGLVTFHGPTGYSSWEGFSLNYFKKTVMNKEPAVMKQPTSERNDFYTIISGKAEGALFGGNLIVMTSIIGSGYLPDPTGKILFLEEIGEEVYRIDRMLTQLKLAGVLDKINGIIFGKCVRCDPEEPEKSLTLRQAIEDHIKPLGIPAFYGSMIGHIKDKFTVPVGINTSINADSGEISLRESAVT